MHLLNQASADFTKYHTPVVWHLGHEEKDGTHEETFTFQLSSTGAVLDHC